MKKEVKKAYIMAAILSVILYSLGIVTGWYIQKKATQEINIALEDFKKRIDSANLEYFYLSTFSQILDCSSLFNLIKKSRQDVWELGKELTALEKFGSGNEKYEKIKHEYMILSAKAWVLNTYLKEKCEENITIILYIYSVPCPECEKQGKILDTLREGKFKDSMLVFVLDYNIKEPIVDTIKDTYQITETPSLIIRDKVYSGLVEKDRLTEIINAELNRLECNVKC